MKKALALFFLLIFFQTSPAAAAGTHFILEGQGSGLVTDEADQGGSGSLLLGYGFGFRRAPLLRIYLACQLGVDSLSGTKTRPGVDATFENIDLTFLAGPRLYLAFNKHFRLFFDLMLGGYSGGTTWTINGLEENTATDGGLAAAFGFGFQFRLMEALSIGARAERMEFSQRVSDENLAAYLGFPLSETESTMDRFRYGITITLHF